MNTIPNQPNRRRISTDRLNRQDCQLVVPLEGEFSPTYTLHPPERPPHTHTPKPDFGGRGHEKLLDHFARNRPMRRVTKLPYIDWRRLTNDPHLCQEEATVIGDHLRAVHQSDSSVDDVVERLPL